MTQVSSKFTPHWCCTLSGWGRMVELGSRMDRMGLAVTFATGAQPPCVATQPDMEAFVSAGAK